MESWNEFCKGVTPLQNKKHIVNLKSSLRFRKSNNSIFHTLDLHEKTLQNAQKEVINYLDNIKQKGIREVTIITGKSGSMLREFPIWIENNPDIACCKLKKNGGSYTVKFKKQK